MKPQAMRIKCKVSPLVRRTGNPPGPEEGAGRSWSWAQCLTHPRPACVNMHVRVCTGRGQMTGEDTRCPLTSCLELLEGNHLKRGPRLVMGQWCRHGGRAGCRRQRRETCGLRPALGEVGVLHVRWGQDCRGGWALEGPADGRGHCGAGRDRHQSSKCWHHLRPHGTRDTRVWWAGDHLPEVRGDNPVSKASRTQTTAPRQEPPADRGHPGRWGDRPVPTDRVNFEPVECKAWTARKTTDF